LDGVSPKNPKEVTNQSNRDLEEPKTVMFEAVEKTVIKMYEDGLTDIHIDKLRQRIIRKEENEKILQREKIVKDAAKKKDMQAIGIK
jgi:hypothetical protein